MFREEAEAEAALDRLDLLGAEPGVQLYACLPEQFAAVLVRRRHGGHCAGVGQTAFWDRTSDTWDACLRMTDGLHDRRAVPVRKVQACGLEAVFERLEPVLDLEVPFRLGDG
jgi:hypothetical protein